MLFPRLLLARLFLGSATLVLLTSANVAAQEPRHHLGRRLKLTEEAWIARENDASKKLLMPAFELAVTSFFTGKFADGAKALDRARYELIAGSAPSAAAWAALGLEVVPTTRCIDASQPTIEATVERFYTVAGASLALADFTVNLVVADGLLVWAQPAAETLSWSAPEQGWPEGDHALVLRQHDGTEISRTAISVVRNFATRMAALQKCADQHPGPAARALRLGAERLNQLATGSTFELEVAASAEVQKLERIAAALEAQQDPFAGGGDWLLDLASDGQRELPARFYAPPCAPREDGTPDVQALPLVVALHGMGGSEHIFFEASGAGRIALLAKQRGWLLVAPKVDASATFVERVINAVAEIRPVDRSRIFLLGHSMGAMRATAAAVRDPELFRAVALFGGAGRAKQPERLAPVAFWVGIGSRDFLRGGALGFVRALEKAEHKRYVLREMEGVEHYTVIQLGLAESFAFFDAEARRDG